MSAASKTETPLQTAENVVNETQKELGTLSVIMSRKAIKSSNWPSTEKMHWEPSGSDLILDQE